MGFLLGLWVERKWESLMGIYERKVGKRVGGSKRWFVRGRERRRRGLGFFVLNGRNYIMCV